MSPIMFLLLQVGSGLPSQVPVTFTQASDQWPVVLSSSGTVVARDSSVTVDLQEIRVADQPNNPNSIRYSSYRVCLAYKPSADSWDKSTCSNPVKVRVNVATGESVDLGQKTLEISTKGHPPVTDFWLVLEMISAPVRGKTYSLYAHSDRSIFKIPTP